VIDEVLLALSKGYKLIRIHEVYHFEEYSSDIFIPYVQKFLKIKQESSGYPEGVETDEAKEAYIKDYYEHQSIKLDKDKIEKCPARRQLAKNCLNYLWGYFSKRPDMTHSKIVNDGSFLLEILGDDSKDLKDIRIFSEDYAQIYWCAHSDQVPMNEKGSIYVGIFTAAYGRMKLYKLLDSLDDRVLYADTDSVIYTQREGEYTPPLGNYLGDLTNELTCKSVGCAGCNNMHYITEFVSGGPKNYAYSVDNGHVETKIRGFTLNHETCKKLNFNALKELIMNDPEGVIETCNPRKIYRDRGEIKIYNRCEIKRYRLRFEKRVATSRGGDIDSLPYGY